MNLKGKIDGAAVNLFRRTRGMMGNPLASADWLS